MFDFLRHLLSTDFMPHGTCFLWQRSVLWLHAISDGTIAAAYYSIPLALIVFVRRRQDLAFRWMFYLFVTFIFACATTHLLGVVTLWIPVYRLDGVVKALTAAVSIGTAIFLWPMVPRALALPSPAQMATANRDLRAQIGERERAEEQVVSLNQELQVRVEQLRRSNEELQQFAYSVSHDLRAPLRAMKGFSDALVEDYGARLDSAGRDYLQRIAAAALRMDALIGDLLAYSRIIRSAPAIEPVPLELVLSDALALVEGEIRDRSARVEVRRPLPLVLGHRGTLVQLVSNLIGNAVKFVAPGVTPEVTVRAERRGEAVRLWVEDNGIGIAAEFHERVFQVFERLHGIDAYPGTGIGLALVQRGAELLGGRAGVESAPGHGSRFYIEVRGA
jgi:signal transduction histidine kinase